QMNESARQLDQSFVESAIRSGALSEPEFFQHIVRFVEKLAIKALEVTEVMGVQVAAVETFDQRGDLAAFLIHHAKNNRQSPSGEEKPFRLHVLCFNVSL